MRALVLVVVAVACGGKAAPPVVDNRAAPPPRPVCAEEQLAEITRDLAARWDLEDPPLVRCAPGRFPVPGFVLDVQLPRAQRKVGIVEVDGRTEIAPFADEGAATIATSVVALDTTDLDGDGTDEIVETWRKSAHGRMGSDTWLVVRRLVDRGLTTIAGPHTSVFHPELGTCAAEVQLAGRTIVITVEHGSGIPPSDCLPPGTHTFALVGERLVELAPTARR